MTPEAEATILDLLVDITENAIRGYHGNLTRESAKVALANWPFVHGLPEAQRDEVIARFSRCTWTGKSCPNQQDEASPHGHCAEHRVLFERRRGLVIVQ